MTVQSGLAAYRGLKDLPPLVARAVEASRELGYDKACLPETGRLLRLLVAARHGVNVGETGTACGVGAAWVASALDPTARLTTVELDPERAATASRLLASNPNVRVLCGDWSLIHRDAPFDILFIDGGPGKSEVDTILGLLAPRGLAVFDDLTPSHSWSDEQRRAYAGGDPVRSAWAARSDCVSVEVMVTPTASVLLVSRVNA